MRTGTAKKLLPDLLSEVIVKQVTVYQDTILDPDGIKGDAVFRGLRKRWDQLVREKRKLFGQLGLKLVESIYRSGKGHTEAASDAWQDDLPPEPFRFYGRRHQLDHRLAAFEAALIEGADEFPFDEGYGHEECRGKAVGLTLVAVGRGKRVVERLLVKNALGSAVKHKVGEFMGAGEAIAALVGERSLVNAASSSPGPFSVIRRSCPPSRKCASTAPAAVTTTCRWATGAISCR
jgi:hypothetical protein